MRIRATRTVWRTAWQVPPTFVAVMALGMAAIPLPFAETGIVLSLLGLGALIAAGARLPLVLSAIIAGVFALFHGYAHGVEMSPGASALAYGSRFVAATSLLRLAGAAVAATGGYLWFAV